METSIIIAIIAFLLLCFIFLISVITGKDGVREHIFLRLILVFFFLNLLLLAARASIDSGEYCEYVNNNTTVTNTYVNNTLMNFTETNNYAYICDDNQTQTAEIFYKNITRLIAAFWIYVLIYVSYAVLKFKGIIKGNGQ